MSGPAPPAPAWGVAASGLGLEHFVGSAPTREGVLWASCWGDATVDTDEGLVQSMPCRPLEPESGCEVWTTDRQARRKGTVGPLSWVSDGELLAVEGRVGNGRGRELAEASYGIYQELLTLLEAEGYPHLLRLWNYMPRINAEEEELERYRHFCRGRSHAFEDHHGKGFCARLPAGSAVGIPGEELVVAGIASRRPGHHLSNPRQVDAFAYPPSYGPRSPSFARATLMPGSTGSRLLLSGTASIVGHESRHLDDVRAQLEETLANIRSLVDAARDGRGDGWIEELEYLRVYLRDRRDLEVVRSMLRERLGSAVRLSFFEADVCRADLLLEIEGWTRALVPPPS